MMPKYKIGNIALVIDSGKTYPRYAQKFELLDFKNKIYNESIDNNTKVIIKNITTHDISNKVLYHIESLSSRSNETLIGERGLKLLYNTLDYTKLEIL